MAKDNKVGMPTSIAGITRYFDDFKSKVRIKPISVIIIIILVMLIILALHKFGDALIGVKL